METLTPTTMSSTCKHPEAPYTPFEIFRSWVEGFRLGENFATNGLKVRWHHTPEIHFNKSFVSGYLFGWNNIDRDGISTIDFHSAFEMEFGQGSWETYINIPRP